MTRRVGRFVPLRVAGRYQRTTALPHEKPEPKPVSETSWPRSSWPARVVSASSIGIEPAEQFP